MRARCAVPPIAAALIYHHERPACPPFLAAAGGSIAMNLPSIMHLDGILAGESVGRLRRLSSPAAQPAAHWRRWAICLPIVPTSAENHDCFGCSLGDV